MKKKTFYFDLDGVICFTKGNKYIQSKPNKKAIKFINELHESGNIIIIFTARFMGRNNDNQSKAKKQGYQFTYNQLKNWNLKFNKLILGKPSYDYYIDDKNYNFDKNWYNAYKKYKK